ncbi:MAG: hypothetical protein ACHQRM_17215 [Bacteroidia bacterium]
MFVKVLSTDKIIDYRAENDPYGEVHADINCADIAYIHFHNRKVLSFSTGAGADTTFTKPVKKPLYLFLNAGTNLPWARYGTNPRWRTLTLQGRSLFEGLQSSLEGYASAGGLQLGLGSSYIFSKKVAWINMVGIDINKPGTYFYSNRSNLTLVEYFTGFRFLAKPYSSRFNMNFTLLLGFNSLNCSNTYCSGGVYLFSSEYCETPGWGYGGAVYGGIGASYKYTEKILFTLNASDIFSHIVFSNVSVTDSYLTSNTTANSSISSSVYYVKETMNVNLIQFTVGVGVNIR